VILTAHATKVNQSEPNWTEPQTRLACQNHALKINQSKLQITETATGKARLPWVDTRQSASQR